jgi:hypothetical protein
MSLSKNVLLDQDQQTKSMQQQTAKQLENQFM